MVESTSRITSSFLQWWGREVLVISVIVVIIYYCYETGLDNSFTFDDHLAIDGNHDVTKEQYDPYVWFHDIWGKDLVEVDSHKSYRPLLILLFRYLWGFEENKARVFRIFSVSMHGIATYLIYHLAKKLRTDSYEGYLIAIGAAVLFASHPIHVESVTAVVNLAEPTSAIFILLSYFLFRQLYSHLLSPLNSVFTIKMVITIALWVACIILATLLKETGIMALLLSLSYSLLMTLYLLLHDYFTNLKLKQSEGMSIQRTNRVVYAGVVSLLLCCGLIYCYFVLREIITSHDRILILSHPQQLMMYFLTYFWRNNGSTSYLNASGLIRRAENPFTFLKGSERVLSYLVSKINSEC